jgi:uncharacterized protein (DUF983 family)
VSLFRNPPEFEVGLGADFETETTLGNKDLLVSRDSEVRSGTDIGITRTSESVHEGHAAMSVTYEAGGEPPRPVWRAIRQGLACRCPSCGEGRLFERYTRVAPACVACGTEFHHQRADDAPPYVVMMIVGHVLVGGALALERALHPDLWVHMAIWIPATIVMSLALLPPVKGAVIAIQWANRMHGFGGEKDGDA